MAAVKTDMHMMIEENAENLKTSMNSAFALIERLSADLN